MASVYVINDARENKLRDILDVDRRRGNGLLREMLKWQKGKISGARDKDKEAHRTPHRENAAVRSKLGARHHKSNVGDDLAAQHRAHALDELNVRHIHQHGDAAKVGVHIANLAMWIQRHLTHKDRGVPIGSACRPMRRPG